MTGRIEFFEEQSPFAGVPSLRRERWVFWYSEPDHALVLDDYEVQERGSPRHKFKTVAAYQRLSARRNLPPGMIREEEVPLTAAVVQRALDDFARSLRVVRWGEIRNR